MSRIKNFYTAFLLVNQTVLPNIPGLQDLKHCIQYLASNPNEPIFYPNNYDDVSYFIRLTCSGNQFGDYTTHNCLECHQYVDHAIILNIRCSVSGINYTLLESTDLTSCSL